MFNFSTICSSAVCVMAEAAAGKLHLLAINYPKELKTAQTKKRYKHKLLRENPECVLPDSSQTGQKITVTNLLLHTDRTDAWHRAICTHYKQHKKWGICNGRQITIDSQDSDASFKAVRLVSALSSRTLTLSEP